MESKNESAAVGAAVGDVAEAPMPRARTVRALNNIFWIDGKINLKVDRERAKQEKILKHTYVSIALSYHTSPVKTPSSGLRRYLIFGNCDSIVGQE